MPLEGFHDRLHQATGGQTTRQIANASGLTIDAVRRTLDGAEPTTEIVQALCTRLDLNAEWLLLGHEPMHASECRRAALRQVPAADLIGSLAVAIRARLDRAAQPGAAGSPAAR